MRVSQRKAGFFHQRKYLLSDRFLSEVFSDIGIRKYHHYETEQENFHCTGGRSRNCPAFAFILTIRKDHCSGRQISGPAFSKPIDSYEFGFMCDCLVQSGIAGFDLTVRPGGRLSHRQLKRIFPVWLKKQGNIISCWT